MRRSLVKSVGAAASVVALVLLLVPVAALAGSSKTSGANAKGASQPPVAGESWYWADQKQQELQDPTGNTYTIEGPNPFCPATPGDLGAVGQTCAPGRLPIEIQGGDYDTPNKLSAVNFDFSLVPIGSKVTSFKVTFLQAKAGCYDQDDDGQPSQNDRCEQTDPLNVGDHKLQACQVNDFFGNGAARPYDELPKYKCVSSDPTAEQKEEKVKGAEHPFNDDTPDHTWTFDLTSLAQKWTTGTVQSSIMLVGAPPKGYDPQNKDPKDDWRVVLAGPEAKEGVVTSLTAVAPPTPAPPPPAPPGSDGVDTGIGTSTGTGFGTGSTDFGTGTTTGSTDFGDAAGTTGDATGVDSGTAPAPQPSSIAASAPGETPNDFPAYMWLAILAGIIGFSLVRSVVIEATTGVRPNGVLAQIKSLNAQRKGTAPVEGPGGPTGVGAALGSVGEGFSTFAGKVKSIFKRG